MRIPSASKIARAYVLKTAKDLPADVERYVQEGKDSGMDEGQAWAIAWSRYCKYKNPGSDHCKQDPSDYFKGRKASTNKEAGKVIYVGAMVEKPQNLLSWWKSHVGALLPKHYAHHMTIKFAPSEAELALLPIGKEVYFEIIGYADDGHVQALVVQPHGVKSKNPVPHVTIATDGTPPVKANELLKNGFTPLGGPKVVARVGMFIDGQDVFEPLPGKTAMDRYPPLSRPRGWKPTSLDSCPDEIVKENMESFKKNMAPYIRDTEKSLKDLGYKMLDSWIDTDLYSDEGSLSAQFEILLPEGKTGRLYLDFSGEPEDTDVEMSEQFDVDDFAEWTDTVSCPPSDFTMVRFTDYSSKEVLVRGKITPEIVQEAIDKTLD